MKYELIENESTGVWDYIFVIQGNLILHFIFRKQMIQNGQENDVCISINSSMYLSSKLILK